MNKLLPFAMAPLMMTASLPGHGQTTLAAITARIAVVAPTTGAIAHLGKDTENGARLAIEELNSASWKINGIPVRFELQAEDDQGDPKSAVVAAQKVIDSKVHGVVGHLNSGTTIVGAKIYADHGIPQVAPAATNPKYTEQGYKTAFRLMATDLQQGPALAQFIATTLKAKKVAFIDDRTAYGQGLVDQVSRQLRDAGVQQVAREYTTASATDFSAILTRLKALDPDVVVYGGSDAQAGPMTKQMQALGMRTRLVGGDGVCTGSWSKLSGGAAEGHYCSQAGKPREAMPGYRNFSARFEKRFGSPVVIFAPYAYDGVMVIANAMRAANSIDPAVYLPVLAKAKYQGVIGDIEFDAKGDNQFGVVTMYRVAGDKLEPVDKR